jgi:hypothetical protein
VTRAPRPAAPGAAALPVPVLRDAIERELASTSLRQAAREIGLSPNALRNFVRGAIPRATTRTRLERWLATRAATPSAASVSTIVRLLGEVSPDLPPRETAAIGRELTESILAAYERRRRPPPRWVRELARHYRVGDA